MSETKRTPPSWVDELALQEAERLYEILPTPPDYARQAQMTARLQVGIVELLMRELPPS